MSTGTNNNVGGSGSDAATLAQRVNRLTISRTQRPEPGRGGNGGGGRPKPWMKWVVIAAVLAAVGGAFVAFQGRIGEALSDLGKGGSTADADSIRTLTVTEQAGGGPPPVLLAGGKIVSDQKVYVSTEVSGRIVAMNVDQGDRVLCAEDAKKLGKEPTIIAVIRDIDYQARLRQAKANVLKAERDVERLREEVARAKADALRIAADRDKAAAEIDRATSEIAKSRADINKAASEKDRAQAEVNRYKTLSDNEAKRWRDTEEFATRSASTTFEVRDARAAAEAADAQWKSSQKAMETADRHKEWAAAAEQAAQSGLKSAKAGLASANAASEVATAAVGKAEADVKVAQAAVDAAAAIRDQEQKRVDDCKVLAPISGVVLERSANVGDYVTEGGGRGGIANSQFVTLADTDHLRVEVDITEQDISKLRPGMPCIIIPDAYKDRKYTGSVMWIDPIGNYSKATVQAKVRINKTPADDEFLRIEGAVKVEFREKPAAGAAPASDKPAIYIPDTALSPDGKVQILDDAGRVRTVSVKTGNKAGGQVEIVSGLTKGKTLLRDFRADFEDGKLVKPPGK